MKIHVLCLVSKSLTYAELCDVLDDYCHYYKYCQHKDIESIDTVDIIDTTDILAQFTTLLMYGWIYYTHPSVRVRICHFTQNAK